MSKTIKALNCVYEDCGHPFTTSDAHFYHEESDLCYCSEGCYEAECAKTKRACDDGDDGPVAPLALTDLNIDVLELIANHLDIDNFTALYLALPKDLWKANTLVERRLILKFDKVRRSQNLSKTLIETPEVRLAKIETEMADLIEAKKIVQLKHQNLS
jgi:hypothetical protein